MRLLILFATWAADNSPNTHWWLNWYYDILKDQFSGDDKFVAVNYDAHRSVEQRFGELDNLLGMERVPERFHVNSDAASFQHAIVQCAPILKNYDYVFFMHTKGASYGFEDFTPWRQAVSTSIFRRNVVAQLADSATPYLIAERGHMVQEMNPIRIFARLAKRLGLTEPAFHYAAGTTLFYAPASAVLEMVRRLPRPYLDENLISIGETRFFFEAPIPSLLTMIGAEPFFVGGARPGAGLSGEVSYNCDPQHNSHLVLREYNRRREQGADYVQVPTPYLIGDLHDVQRIGVSFAV